MGFVFPPVVSLRVGRLAVPFLITQSLKHTKSSLSVAGEERKAVDLASVASGFTGGLKVTSADDVCRHNVTAHGFLVMLHI